MKAEELKQRIRDERIVRVSADVWADVVDEFEEVERHSTFLAGDLVIVRGAAGLAAVEEPSRDVRVIRRLDDTEDMRRFVQQRLEEYERMWDGCGCRIDYYS